MNNTISLINAVKYARKTGYLLHDLRDPDFYEQDQAKSIKELDRAYIEATNSLSFSFAEFAGFGESGVALEMSDALSDDLLEVDDDGAAFKIKDIYGTAFPFFKVNMKKWKSTLSDSERLKLEQYWSQHAS